MLVGSQPRRVAVIGGARIPFARAHGAYASVGNQEMLTASLKAVVDKYGLKGARLGDVVAGAVLKHSSQWNLARESLLDSGLSPETPGLDVQRACGTSLEAAIADRQRRSRSARSTPASPAESTPSAIRRSCSARDTSRSCCAPTRAKSFGARIAPFLGLRPRHFKPHFPGVVEPRTGLSMGEHTASRWRKTWQISRADQDALANRQPREREPRLGRGLHGDLVVPYLGLAIDNNVRADTTPRKAREAQAIDREGRHADRGQLDADDRRSRRRADRERGVGALARARRAGLPDPRQAAAVDFVGGRGPADGARLRRAAHARGRGPHAAGLRFLRDPRGICRAGAVHAESLGVGRSSAASVSDSPGPLGSDRPREAQRQGRQRRRGPPVRSDRSAHRSQPRQAPRRPRHRAAA